MTPAADQVVTHSALPPVQRRSSYDAVFESLRDEIVGGRWPIGAQLPTESDLCDTLGVTRSTVREGIRALEQAGLVRRTPSRRLEVSKPDIGQRSIGMMQSVALERVTLAELWLVEAELDKLATRLACDWRDPAAVAALDDNLAAQRAAQGDADALVRLDIGFHQLIAAASGNRAVPLARDPFGALLLAGSDFVLRGLPQAAGRMIEAHAHIVAAIRARDTGHAVLWMTRHMADFYRGFEMAGADPQAPMADYVDIARLSRLSPD